MFFPLAISIFIGLETLLPLGHAQSARTTLTCLYFLPWFPFQVVAFESIYKGGAEVFMKLNPSWAWVCLSLQPLIYFVLYLYLDNVIPNAYGISKDCFYCLRCRRQNYERLAQEDSLRTSVNQPADPNSDSDNVREFNINDPIRLERLTKKFGKFTAVEKMTVSIKGNEVFTILGHNGAGKTTAIYMLTGMLKPSSGEATLYDNTITNEIDDVRKNLGLCQQFDVLYNELTAYEHLLLTCRIKGIQQDMER